MNYLVAVLGDRAQAEAAYSALEQGGVPIDKVAILGKGYQSIDDYGLVDPREQAAKQAKLMAFWLIPFGLFAGLTFNAITGLETFAWAGEFGNRAIGGLLGAVSGALGSYLIGGGVGLISRDALPYRDRLNQGKYLVVLKGSDALSRQTTRILRPFEPENMQSFSDGTSI
jgi:hypothetical protein